MSTTEKQQSTDERQGAPEADSQGSGSLEDFLKEFDETTSRPQKSSAGSELKEVVDFARRSMQRDQQKELENDLDQAFQTVTERDELKRLRDVKNGKSLTRGLLEAYAADNPEFAKAFQNRSENPRQWKEALSEASGVVKDWISELNTGKKDNVRDDIEAAKAAVTGVDEGEEEEDDLPSSEELMGMSDVEYRKLTQKLERQTSKPAARS